MRAAAGRLTGQILKANLWNQDGPGVYPIAGFTYQIIYTDLNNPANGFTDAEYQAIANEFEQVVWPTDTQNFGTPTDIDGNGKVIILYTRAVNELSPANSNVVIGGFYYARDLFPRTPTQGFEACTGSNYGEMFYMLVPDPSGAVNNNVRSKSYVRSFTLGTVAHEFQHLINASRRIYVNNADDYETVWLDEGLAHIAEELNFYAATNQAPRQNLNEQQLVGTTQAAFNAFAAYQFQNFARLGEYLASPPNHSPWDDDDDLEQRGAAWSLLRYMADRRNGNDQQLWFGLVNTTTRGFTNLQAAFGTDPVLLARDWSVMLYTDDAVPASSAFQFPSWNLRDVYRNQNFGGSYPLQVTALTAGTSSVQIKSGSAAYRKFAVAPATSADVRVIQNSGTVAGACTPVNLAVGGVQQLTLGAGVALCFPGGATGAEYAVIPFHAQPQQDTTVTVSMTATGVLPPVGPPNPDALTPRAPLFQLDGTSISHPYDAGFELRLRERERRLGKTLVARFNRADLVSAVASVIYVNVVRTK